MEALIGLFVVLPFVMGLCYVLLYIFQQQNRNDRTIQRLEPIVSDCRWTRKKFYDDEK